MAKATRANGPSHTDEELADPELQEKPVRIRRPELGHVDREKFDAEQASDPQVTEEEEEEEVTPSAGTRSSRSTAQKRNPAASSSANRRKPAPATENPSRAEEQEIASDADSAAGVGQKTTTPQSDDEFDEFE